MAARYWVGGAATWDGTALLKWALTSGGLGGQAVPTSSDTVFFDASSGANTVTIGSGTAICSTLTMTGFTGTLAFGTNSITCAGSGTGVFTGATTHSVTGTPLINITGTGTLTLLPASVTEANSISFTINNAASNAIGVSGSVKNLTFAGTYTGNLTNGTRTLYGNLTLKSGMTLSAGASVTTFAATSGTQQITSAALNLDFPITFSGTATYQLQDALNVGTATSRTVTLTTGTLDLAGFTFTLFGGLSSNNSNTRAIAFGTGNYTNICTVNGINTWGFNTATGFTYTGTPIVNITGASAVGTTKSATHGNTAGQTETNSPSFNISAGSGDLTFLGGFLNVNFTGYTGSLANGARTIYGNLTVPAAGAIGVGMTITGGASATTFASTNATVRTITTNSNTLDFPITFNGVGGSWRLQDALTVGTSRNISLTNGSFDTNTKSFTCGTFNFSNANTKTLTLGTSTVTITGGTSTSGFLGSNTGTTYDVANSTIVFTTTGSAIFVGGSGGTSGTLYGTITMLGSGGTLYLGNSTGGTVTARCTTLNNTVSPCTITNSCTTAFTVTNFNVNGTAGNLVVLNSNTAGTARTITKASGTTDVDYLNIQDSTATGGTWNAYGSTNSGNNTGWNFLTRNNGNFLMFF